MGLPRSLNGQINKRFLSLKPIGKAVQEKSYKNNRTFEFPEKDMRCSEMVEVIE